MSTVCSTLRVQYVDPYPDHLYIASNINTSPLNDSMLFVYNGKPRSLERLPVFLLVFQYIIMYCIKGNTQSPAFIRYNYKLPPTRIFINVLFLELKTAKEYFIITLPGHQGKQAK